MSAAVMPMRNTVSASAIRGRLAPAATASAIAKAAVLRFPVVSLHIAANSPIFSKTISYATSYAILCNACATDSNSSPERDCCSLRAPNREKMHLHRLAPSFSGQGSAVRSMALSPCGVQSSICDERTALFRQQRKGAVPVFRRRIFPIVENAGLIQIVEQFQAARIVALAAALDRRQRAFPIPVAVTCQHLDRQVAQELELAGLRDVVTAGDGIDDLRLLLAFDHDEIEFENGELVFCRKRSLRAGDDRKAVFLGLSLQPRSKIDAVAEHRIVEFQVGAHVTDHTDAGVETDADIDRDEGMSALPGFEFAHRIQLINLLKHVERRLTGIDLMFLVVERRVPERHDGVAHIFVDVALARS